MAIVNFRVPMTGVLESCVYVGILTLMKETLNPKQKRSGMICDLRDSKRQAQKISKLLFRHTIIHYPFIFYILYIATVSIHNTIEVV